MANIRWMRALITCALLLTCLPLTLTAQQSKEIIFSPLKLDGPVDDPANDSYWFGPFCETASVLDADGDGDLDIAGCRNWFENPLWIKHPDFRDGAEVNGPETESNAEFSLDVNKDGRTDVVASGWMFMKGVYWYENPGEYATVELTKASPDAVDTRQVNKETIWPSHKVHQAYNMEGIIHGDIDDDGDEDILVNHWALREGQGMTWLEHIDEAPWFIEHEVGTDGEVHGNALGDINMDGRMDIVTPVGWYEQPERNIDGTWEFHADYAFKPAHLEPDAERINSGAAHPFLVHDVNEDGLNDVIISSAHTYGFAWLENKVDANGERSFDQHFIETEYAVFHTMALGDLNGDGKDDLVIGKRLMAHYGRDDGAFEPMVVFWYDIKGGDFERHILSYNHLPHFPDEGGINPFPNQVIGVGMKINIADIDADGDNDVVLAGKGGLYLMVNQGSPPNDGAQERLPSYATYDTWRSWGGYNESLFNGKDFTGWKVPEGDNGHWTVKDFVIDYDALSEAEDDKNLWTEKEYCNYNLHLDWRFTRSSGMFDMPTILPDGTYLTDENGNIPTTPMPNGDSGVFLRGPAHQVNLWGWPVGSGELWTVRNNSELSPERRAAAVPKMNTDNPIGEWNSMDIKMVGDRVSVMQNGHWIIENAIIAGGLQASTSQDADGNMVITTSPIGPLPECGPIGLQHHGGIDPETGEMIATSSLVQFRNLYIDPIEDDELTQEEDGGWESLFNGEDLTGWITGADNKFAVENGELTVKRENADGREYNLSYLWTEDRYDDFELELEFKIVEGTNSGVFFRTDDIMDPVYTGLEAQVGGVRPGPIRKGSVGGVYGLQEPSEIAVNEPGEWNTYRLMCKGSRIVVELNGITTVDMDIARWRVPNMNPDGTWNKFATPGAAFSREGHIGFQDHGRPVWYRNIRVRRL